MRALVAALATALVVTVLVAPVQGVTLCTTECTSRYETPLGFLVPWGPAGWAIPVAVAVVAYWLARASFHQGR